MIHQNVSLFDSLKRLIITEQGRKTIMATHLLNRFFQSSQHNGQYRELLTLVHNDNELANRLINLEKIKHPGETEQWYLEKVIYDFRRDV